MSKQKNSSVIIDEYDEKHRKLKKWGPKSLDALQELIDKGILAQNSINLILNSWSEDEFLEICHKLKRNRYKTIEDVLISKKDLNNSGKKFVESIDKASSKSDTVEDTTNDETAEIEPQAHVKHSDDDIIQSPYETTKQINSDDQCKKVDCVSNNGTSQDNATTEDGQDEQSDDDDDEETDDTKFESESNAAETDGDNNVGVQPGLHQEQQQAAGRDTEEPPQYDIPTECTSPPDDKPVKVTFVLTVSSRESNDDQIMEPTDCTSPPDSDITKLTFVVTVPPTSDKTQLPQEFPMELPDTKHTIPEPVIIMSVQETIPKQEEQTSSSDGLVTGHLVNSLIDGDGMNNDIGETSELGSGDDGYCDCDGAASETSTYRYVGPAEVVDLSDEDEEDDDNDF